jgi:hypothetical protein
MPRVQWPLRAGRPCVELNLITVPAGQPLPRSLLADSGAGSQQFRIELILLEGDCLRCGASPLKPIKLGGAYSGWYPTYVMTVELAGLGVLLNVRAAAVPSAPVGFDGIACFRFINRFTYGNFGDPTQFGLEC